MAKFSAASKKRLETCHPTLQLVLQDAIEIVDFTIVEGHRDQAGQDAAFAAKTTQLRWPNGKHNKWPSYAVDVAPVYYEAGKMKIDWNDLIAFGRIMGVIQACAHRRGVLLRFGLDWDGDFRSVNRDPGESFLDAPHIELV